jgi:tetratricopeptide (TPR) repeat protein
MSDPKKPDEFGLDLGDWSSAVDEWDKQFDAPTDSGAKDKSSGGGATPSAPPEPPPLPQTARSRPPVAQPVSVSTAQDRPSARAELDATRLGTPPREGGQAPPRRSGGTSPPRRSGSVPPQPRSGTAPPRATTTAPASGSAPPRSASVPPSPSSRDRFRQLLLEDLDAQVPPEDAGVPDKLPADAAASQLGRVSTPSLSNQQMLESLVGRDLFDAMDDGPTMVGPFEATQPETRPVPSDEFVSDDPARTTALAEGEALRLLEREKAQPRYAKPPPVGRPPEPVRPPKSPATARPRSHTPMLPPVFVTAEPTPVMRGTAPEPRTLPAPDTEGRTRADDGFYAEVAIDKLQAAPVKPQHKPLSRPVVVRRPVEPAEAARPRSYTRPPRVTQLTPHAGLLAPLPFERPDLGIEAQTVPPVYVPPLVDPHAFVLPERCEPRPPEADRLAMEQLGGQLAAERLVAMQASARRLCDEAHVLSVLGRPSEADELYREAAEAGAPVALRALLRHALKSGDLAESMHWLAAYADCCAPSEAGMVELLRAALLRARGDTDGAHGALEKAPGSPIAGWLRLLLSLAGGEREDAARELGELETSDEAQRGALRLEQARLFERAFCDDAALVAYDLAAAVPGTAGAAAIGRSRVVLRAGSPVGAARAMSTEAEHAQAAAPALLRRAATLYEVAGQPSRALELMLDLSTPLALERAAELALETGQLAQAQPLLERWAAASAFDPARQALAFERLGDLRAQAGHGDDAAVAYRAALSAYPSVPAELRFERAAPALSDVAARVATLEHVAEADPPRATQLLTAAGRLELGRDATEAARTLFERAHAADAEYGPALHELAALDTATGQPAAIGDRYARVAARKEGVVRIALLEQAACAAARAGDPDAALARRKHAAAVPGSPAPLAQGVGDPERLHMEAARTRDPQEAAQLHYERGWLLFAAGDRETARGAFTDAVRADPGHPAALWAREVCVSGAAPSGELMLARATAAKGRSEAIAHAMRAALEFESDSQLQAARGALQSVLDVPGAEAVVGPELLRLAAFDAGTRGAAEHLVVQAKAAGSPAARASCLVLAGAAHELAGDERTAAERYAQAAAALPNDVLEYTRDRLRWRLGDFAGLAERTRLAVRTADGPHGRVRALGRLADLAALGQGDWAAAAVALGDLLEVDPGHHPSLRTLERFLSDSTRERELAAHYERIAAAVTDTQLACALLLERARILRKHGGLAAAEPGYKQVLARDPHALDALLALASLVRGNEAERERSLRLHLALAETVAYDQRWSGSCLRQAADDAEQLNQPDAVRTHHRAAAERDGDDLAGHYVALEASIRTGDNEGTCTAAERIMGRARTPEHRLTAALVAGLTAEQLGDNARAVLAYRGALVVDHKNGPAFARLRRLLDASGRHAELAMAIDTRIAEETDVWQIVELRLALAEIHQAHLSDPDRARAELALAHKAQPHHLPTLRARAALEVATRRWEDAVAALEEVARNERTPERLQDVYTQLGHIHEHERANPRAALTAYARALRHAPTDRELVARVAQLSLAIGEQAGALAAAQKLVELAQKPADKRDAYLMCALILDGAQPPDAVRVAEAIRRAHDADPTDLRPIDALAQLYAGDPRSLRIHLDRGLKTARRMLQEQPFDADAWRVLARILTHFGADERAAAAGCIRSFVDPDAPVVEARTAEVTAGLHDPAVAEVIFRSGALPALRHLVAALDEPLGRVLRSDPRRYGVSRNTRLPRTSPIAAAFEQVARELRFATELEIHVSDTAPTLCVAESGEPALVVLGRALVARPDPGSLRFVAGRTLYLLATRMSLAARLSGEELGLFIGGVVWQFVPGYIHTRLPEKALYDSAQRMNKLLPRKVRDIVMPHALECSGDLDFEAITRAVQHAGDRAGLLLAGDTQRALELTWLMSGQTGPMLRGDAFVRVARSLPAVSALMRFAVSEELDEIRRLLS